MPYDKSGHWIYSGKAPMVRYISESGDLPENPFEERAISITIFWVEEGADTNERYA